MACCLRAKPSNQATSNKQPSNNPNLASSQICPKQSKPTRALGDQLPHTSNYQSRLDGRGEICPRQSGPQRHEPPATNPLSPRLSWKLRSCHAPSPTPTPIQRFGDQTMSTSTPANPVSRYRPQHTATATQQVSLRHSMTAIYREEGYHRFNTHHRRHEGQHGLPGVLRAR